MMLRTGIVVETHPEDHSVDLVMADNGDRLVGIQVMTMNGSTRTGSVDMPEIKPTGDKWDISKPTGQDMKAVVAPMGHGRHPVVIGFLYPQINQILHKDTKLRYDRHQSDVVSTIDGDGNIQIAHPSGAYIRIGESPDKVDLSGKNADSNAAFDRNTGKKVNVRVSLAGQAVEITMSPDGNTKLTMKGNLDIEADGDARLKCQKATTECQEAIVQAAEQVTLDTPQTTCKGNLTVEGMFTFMSGMAGSGGEGTTAKIDGNVEITQNVQVGGDLQADGSITDGNGDGGA